jgi:hypothetical protein
MFGEFPPAKTAIFKGLPNVGKVLALRPKPGKTNGILQQQNKPFPFAKAIICRRLYG